jgi:1,4-alpha-glucan branching enzyme
MAKGYISIVLHSHLPYLIHHGVWPHGLDWLHEAAAETYVPLLGMIEAADRRGLKARFSINLTPVLLEQLLHPTFLESFPQYLEEKAAAARRDQNEFLALGEGEFLEQARQWELHYRDVERRFVEGFGSNLVAAFSRLAEGGQLELMTCAATHGYVPLLGTDASINAQVRLAVSTHQKMFGRKPRGIWLPECGYRPAGRWEPPHGEAPPLLKRARAGVEEILAANGLQYFVCDTHLLDRTVQFSPYEKLAQPPRFDRPPERSPYRPYFVGPPRRAAGQVAAFVRDPQTGVQVWSGEHGYPGDANYLDFHKKRWPTGLRYWQVTHPKIDLGGKQPYSRTRAVERTRDHARHFVSLTQNILRAEWARTGRPGILVAAFDAELFGHWWFEGPEFLEHVLEELALQSEIETISLGGYFDLYPPDARIDLPEGSWGRGGGHEMWWNADTEWTWRDIYPAEAALLELISSGVGKVDPTERRLLQQLCRELLLLESSDWQFLISTGSARDYAEKRFRTHRDWFLEIFNMLAGYRECKQLSGAASERLAEIEATDSIFADLDLAIYQEWAATGNSAAMPATGKVG